MGHKPAQRLKLTAAIASEAGRIMANEAVEDFHTAKLKARDRLGLGKDAPLPSNREVQQARDQHLQLFTPPEQLVDFSETKLRNAIEALEFFSQFQAKLVADFLDHPVSSSETLELHLQSDNVEAVALLLDDHALPYEQALSSVRLGQHNFASVPVFSLTVDHQDYNVLVFSSTQIRQAPRDPVTGGGQTRIGLEQAKLRLGQFAN